MADALDPDAVEYANCEPEDWDAWFLQVVSLGSAAEHANMDFLETVGGELKSQGVSFAANFNQPMNALQMGRLRNKLRGADLKVSDVLTTEAYKGKKEEWWFNEGCKYCDRLIGKFSITARDVLTPEMMSGITLSPTECKVSVTDKRFDKWESAMEKNDYKKAAAIISPATAWGKMLTRAWIFFRSQADKVTKNSKLNPDDVERPRLNAALLRMTQLWESHVQCELKSLYPNRRAYQPSFRQFHELLHTALSGWDSAKGQYGEHLFKAVALLAGHSDKTVKTCGPHQLAKAMRAALKLLQQMIPQTDKTAKQLAVEVLEIWADADPYFSQYADFYGGAGQEPYDLMSRFLSPVFNEWAQELWAELRNPRIYDPSVKTLGARLTRDYMRERPDWGMSTLIERAAGLSPLPKGRKPSRDTRTPTAGDEVIKCDACGGSHMTYNCKGGNAIAKAAKAARAAAKKAERDPPDDAQSSAKRKAAADARESKARRRLNVAEPQEGQQFSSVPPDFFKEMTKLIANATPATPATGDLPPLPPGEMPRRRSDTSVRFDVTRDPPNNANRDTNRSTGRG